jgi:hypothetical protein
MMSLMLASIGTNITLGLITATTTATNGLYTLSNNISTSTSTGIDDIKQIIKERDLEARIKMIQFLLCEIQVNNKSPCTLNYCMYSIKNAIKNISNELEKIYYRMQYNNNLWIGSSIRAYGFKNCKLRLKAHIDTLESRYKMLISILSIDNKMYRNPELEHNLSQSIMISNDIDTHSASQIRHELHKRLEYINE